MATKPTLLRPEEDEDQLGAAAGTGGAATPLAAAPKPMAPPPPPQAAPQPSPPPTYAAPQPTPARPPVYQPGVQRDPSAPPPMAPPPPPVAAPAPQAAPRGAYSSFGDAYEAKDPSNLYRDEQEPILAALERLGLAGGQQNPDGSRTSASFTNMSAADQRRLRQQLLGMGHRDLALGGSLAGIGGSEVDWDAARAYQQGPEAFEAFLRGGAGGADASAIEGDLAPIGDAPELGDLDQQLGATLPGLPGSFGGPGFDPNRLAVDMPPMASDPPGSAPPAWQGGGAGGGIEREPDEAGLPPLDLSALGIVGDREYTPGAFGDLFGEGAEALQMALQRQREAGTRNLSEVASSRGLVGSSIEAGMLGDLEADLAAQGQQGLYDLFRERLGFEQQGAQIGLQERALRLSAFTADRDEAFRWAQLERDAGFRAEVQRLQALGMDMEEAYRYAEMNFRERQAAADRELEYTRLKGSAELS